MLGPSGGTSSAAPCVAGVVALLASIDPSLDHTRAEQLLRASADDQLGDANDTPGWDQYHGAGRLNAGRALALASAANPPQPLNISTRGRVGAGDEVMIGGFIVAGAEAKRVLVRALGPSLSTAGVLGFLPDPTLRLIDATGQTIASNNNWKATQQGEIEASGIAPANDAESAIALLARARELHRRGERQPRCRGRGAGGSLRSGRTSNSKLANVSTRGLVGVNDNALIGGVILGGTAGTPLKIMARGSGAIARERGCGGRVARSNPGTLQPRRRASWPRMTTGGRRKRAEIEASGIPPSDDAESAIMATLSAGNYTAVLRGKSGAAGVGLIEFYHLP